ncbi:methyltransferase-like protein 22 isoform X5 [Saccopteryx bilineata]|uniref:methyltransferase-like protein 22 isoform X5 n=1 Tax=Saccopteryx bilineata TaxID=59482 RepID=UPI00338E1509
MDEVTFKSDTVLSDVHLYTPNQRHLMVRLNSMRQPVFLSQFQLVWNQDPRIDSGTQGDDHRAVPTEETPAGTGSTGSPPGSSCSSEGSPTQAGADVTGQEGAGAQLDEDGDLDVVRRPRAPSDPDPVWPLRDKVHPMILTQEEDEVLGDKARESSTHDIIRIEHTMATPLEDVGKQVWRGALLLADYILFQWDLFQGRTVLELGAGTGLASVVAATLAQTVYCTDVGADLLAMCQQNLALNSHLTGSGASVPRWPCPCVFFPHPPPSPASALSLLDVAVAPCAAQAALRVASRVTLVDTGLTPSGGKARALLAPKPPGPALLALPASLLTVPLQPCAQ